MPTPLFLLEPDAAAPDWAPFAGARPLAELRAGVWKIRERWEAALDTDAAGSLAGHSAGFHEGFEPLGVGPEAVAGPAIVAAAWFAPDGSPISLEPAIRRIECGGETVA